MRRRYMGNRQPH